MSAIRTAMVILAVAVAAAGMDARAQTAGPPISLRPPQSPAPVPAQPQPPAPPPVAAPVPLPAPSPVPQAAPPAETAEEVVRAFYAAMGAADGARANAYLVAEKRNQGPYEIHTMGAFYGAMAEPLRLLDAKEIMQGLVRVRYHYVHRSGRRCDGTADVIVVPAGGRLLIERIRAFNGC